MASPKVVQIIFSLLCLSLSISNGKHQVHEICSSNSDCEAGMFCAPCLMKEKRCVRFTATNLFATTNTSLPFNKYSFLATHNSFAIEGLKSRTGTKRVTFTNQEDSVTQQLNNGVRVILLDTYDFKGDIWLCHSFKGQCHDPTAFNPAIETLKEIEAFLSKNPSEIVTVVLEDYVKTPKGLTNLFTKSGLKKFWFPVEKMPKNGKDWPLVKDIIASNQRLIVFTSDKSKQQTEGIAYQWNYMVENQYGNVGEKTGKCSNRNESASLTDKTKSLVFVNHFKTVPVRKMSCSDNSKSLMDIIGTCHTAAGNRWANFVAVDFYKRSDGGGAFKAVDELNGKMLCGCNDVHACKKGSSAKCIK